MPNVIENAVATVAAIGNAAKDAARGRVGIYATLSKEHREVDGLMAEVAQTEADDAERRRELFAKIRIQLLSHARAEEAVFYAALESGASTEEKIEHAKNEHAEVETLIEELGEMQFDHQSWMNKFLKLKSSVEHHVHEEENELYERAQELLSPSDARTLDVKYQKRREQEEKRLS